MAQLVPVLMFDNNRATPSQNNTHHYCFPSFDPLFLSLSSMNKTITTWCVPLACSHPCGEAPNGQPYLRSHDLEDVDGFLELTPSPQDHHKRGVRDHIRSKTHVEHVTQKLLRLPFTDEHV